MSVVNLIWQEGSTQDIKIGPLYIYNNFEKGNPALKRFLYIGIATCPYCDHEERIYYDHAAFPEHSLIPTICQRSGWHEESPWFYGMVRYAEELHVHKGLKERLGLTS